MALTVNAIMTADGQQLPFARDLREALAIYARRTWPLNTSGCAAKAWKLPKSTVANLLKGHASDATVTTVLRAGGWKMAAAVVGAVIGQSLEQHLDEELEAIRAEQSRLDELERVAQTRWAALATRRAAEAGEARPDAPAMGQGSDRLGARQAVASRQRGRS